jgi:hypothetical protein
VQTKHLNLLYIPSVAQQPCEEKMDNLRLLLETEIWPLIDDVDPG